MEVFMVLLAFFLAGLPFEPAPGSPFAVGRTPLAVAVADVNRNGRLDVITANQDSSDVTVLLGGGTGRFDAGSRSTAGIQPGWMASADLNGDGDADLVLTEHESHRAAVLLGDGRGTFRHAAGSPLSVLRAPREHNHGVFLPDVDGDGKLDLVTANNLDQSVSVLLGDGRGSFRPFTSGRLGLDRMPAAIALGDLDGDGRLDLLAASEGWPDLTVWFGDGRGAFRAAPGSPVSLTTTANNLALGDLNGDAKPDLVVGHNESPVVTVLLGDGRGSFRGAATFDVGHLPRRPQLVDLDRDGKADLVLLDTGGGAVTLWRGDGRGSFAHVSRLDTGKSPIDVAAADLDGDGRLDLAIANRDAHSVTVLLARR
jgi:hypothetical protein